MIICSDRFDEIDESLSVVGKMTASLELMIALTPKTCTRSVGGIAYKILRPGQTGTFATYDPFVRGRADYSPVSYDFSAICGR